MRRCIGLLTAAAWLTSSLTTAQHTLSVDYEFPFTDAAVNKLVSDAQLEDQLQRIRIEPSGDFNPLLQLFPVEYKFDKIPVEDDLSMITLSVAKPIFVRDLTGLCEREVPKDEQKAAIKQLFTEEELNKLEQTALDSLGAAFEIAASEPTPTAGVKQFVWDRVDEIKRNYYYPIVQRIVESVESEANLFESDAWKTVCCQFDGLDDIAQYVRPPTEVFLTAEEFFALYEARRSTVAIARSDGDMEGTGVVIGDDLVLTALHVLESNAVNNGVTPNLDPDDWQVWHQSTDDEPAEYRKFKVKSFPRWGAANPAIDGDWLLDFALIEVGRELNKRKRINDVAATVTLSRTHPKRFERVYMWAHPADAGLTYTDGVVRYPYEVSNAGWEDFLLHLCSETPFDPDFNPGGSGMAGVHSNLDAIFEPVLGFYVEFSAKACRRLVGPMNPWKNDAFGYTVPTKSGSSGAPVLQDGLLVGIHRYGKHDIHPTISDTPKTSRGAVPIVAILEQLDEWDQERQNNGEKSWVKHYDVTIAQ